MKLVTTKDAALTLGVTEERVRQFIREERLPAVRMGRDYVIQEVDLKLVAVRKTGRPPLKTRKVAARSVARSSDGINKSLTGTNGAKKTNAGALPNDKPKIAKKKAVKK